METLLSYNLIMFYKIKIQILRELLKVNYYLQKKKNWPFIFTKNKGEIDS